MKEFLEITQDIDIKKARFYAEKLGDTTFLLEMAYLSDIFDRLNELNLYLQGNNMNKFLAHSRIEFMKASLDILIILIRDINRSIYTKFAKLSEILQIKKCNLDYKLKKKILDTYKI